MCATINSDLILESILVKLHALLYSLYDDKVTIYDTRCKNNRNCRQFR